MQTVYYTTSNFIRHSGNVVDLGEYRRKLASAEEALFPSEPEEETSSIREIFPGAAQLETPEQKKQRRQNKSAWLLDIWASLSVVAMTTAFTLTVIMG